MARGICAECLKEPVYVGPGGRSQGYCKRCMYELHALMRAIKKEYPYELTLEVQGGVCALCREPPEPGETFQYDHDHKTKKFRGLLCCQCNQGFAGFRDRIDLLQRAIVYLEDPNRLKYYMEGVINYVREYERRHQK